jgi:serine/threonine-protein kinase RsbW
MCELGVTDDDSDAVVLALSEACTNVVCHACPGDLYEVTIAIGAAASEVRIVDQGRGSITGSETTMPEASVGRGRGMALMRALMDEVSFNSVPGRGSAWYLVKQLRHRS